MTSKTPKKPKFLMSSQEAVRRAGETLDFFGESISSKGGQARAALYAERDAQIRAKYQEILANGAIKKNIVADLVKKHDLSPSQIYKIVRSD